MGILKEFRDFAVGGNMVDMAVGIIIGGAFGTVVTSLVSDLMKPPLDYLVANSVGNTEGWRWDIAGDGKFVVDMSKFFAVIVGFLITALAVFILVKAINKARAIAKLEKQAAAPAESDEVKLLREIRDALKAR